MDFQGCCGKEGSVNRVNEITKELNSQLLRINLTVQEKSAHLKNKTTNILLLRKAQRYCDAVKVTSTNYSDSWRYILCTFCINQTTLLTRL